jgi:hypothetical protein
LEEIIIFHVRIPSRRNFVKFLNIILIGLLLVGCTPAPIEATTSTSTPVVPTNIPTLTSTVTPLPEPDPVLVGGGDIAHCKSEGDEITANLLDGIPGTVFTTGDMERPKSSRTATIQRGDVTRNALIPRPETMIIILRTQQVISIISVQGQANRIRAITVTIWVPGMSLF